MTAEQIAHLRELLAKATPGPWETWVCMPIGKSEDWRPHQLGPPNGADSDAFAECDEEPDAQLIAEAVNALPELLDHWESTRKIACFDCGAEFLDGEGVELQAELDRYKKALERALNGLAMNREVVERDVNRILAGEEE